jgi:formylglycine-generating enzyme required for sulfatase activity
MHRFLVAYENGWRPDAGDGKNPRNEDDTGWDEDWSASLPATAQELSDALGSSECPHATWTPDPNENATMPINCVTWFVAQAFCIWDGGRLPTEAEWNFVAGNGQEERIYPWSVPRDSQTISEEYAVYAVDGVEGVPEPTGGKAKGIGYFGHYDLAGNVSEWMLDAFSICYLTQDQCNDCGDPTSDDGQRATRGGSFINFPEDLALSVRSSGLGSNGAGYTGFRCARDL